MASRYDAFYLMVPPALDSIREMFLTKFDELFGPLVSARVFTFEQTKHAKTVLLRQACVTPRPVPAKVGGELWQRHRYPTVILRNSNRWPSA